MTGLVQDLRYAVRQLLKSPGFSVLAVLTLTIGIGATTAIFSVVYGVLLRPLPYPDPNHIVALYEITTKGTWNRLADLNFNDFRDQSHSFQAMAKYADDMASISGGSEPTRSLVASVSPKFFTVFRVQPILGRNFDISDARKGAAPVAVVSYGYWKQYLGSARDLAGLHLKIDNAIFAIIGVVPDGFAFPHDAALWIASDINGEDASRTAHNYDAIARLRDGVTVEQARAEISAIARRIHDRESDQNEFLLKDGTVVPLQESITGQTRPALLVLLVAVGFLLLVASANVANLRLAQASARGRELAIRSALGAPRRRLIRQFVTEAFVVSLLGGGLGVLGAFFGVAALIALAPKDLPRLDEVSIHTPVLVFAFVVSCFVAVGLGAFIAIRATSGDVREGLAEGGREQASSRSGQRMGRGIVAAQIAITLVLVVGAGLLGRSLMKVLEVDPGFRVDKIVTMDVSLPWTGWFDEKAKTPQAIFFRNLIDRLQQIPGVRQVGATSVLPMDGGLPNGMFVVMPPNEAPPRALEGFNALWQQKQRLGVADFCVATEGYFQALGISLLRGRMFDENDRRDSLNVALISASLARERWPGQDPIGQAIEFGNMDGNPRLLTIVGVVADVHENGADAPVNPTVYVDLFQRPRSAMTVTMLSDAATGLVTSAAHAILKELNPEIPPRFRTFSQVYSVSLGSRRFNLTLIGFFASTALLLATAGVFGVMAYSVSRRTREIGVRVAMGASSRDVLIMVLKQGFRTVLIGVAAGLTLSLALTRVIQSLLFGIKATDLPTFSFVVLILVVTALLACYVPARRAAKVDPVVALRYE